MRRNFFQATGRLVAVLLFPLILSSCATDKLLREQIAFAPSVSDKAFDDALYELTGVTLAEANHITELVNGEQFFPSMLEAIRDAQRTIEFENFVWRSGEISTRFIEALCERANAGVKIRFLVDAIGAGKFSEKDVETLRDAGVEFAKYNPLSFAKMFSVNHRTHRKTLVVDGEVGFIGGISVADEWFYETENPGRWRDSNYRVEGPMVSHLRRIFLANWAQATGQSFAIETNATDAPGQCDAACFMSGPGEGETNARRVYLLSIAAARESIRLAHSYFVPDNLATKLLIEARGRGVKVEILTPGNVNLNFVRRASRSRWKKLLEAGVEFYEYEPTKYHLKLMIVDDLWVTAGSINFDARSFRINDEANFVVRNKEFAESQIATFESDKLLSRRVDLEKFRQRSWWTKLSEHFFGLFRFQL